RSQVKPARSRVAMQRPEGGPSPFRGVRQVSREFFSKPKQKSLAAADVSQRLLIGRAEELIAQTQPAAQLRRCLRYTTGPTLACEVRVEIRKIRILSERQQCDARAFGYG